jgi:hypothetical protein
MPKLYFLFLTVCGLFLLSPAAPPIAVDIDGDGAPDRIVFEGKPDGDTFKIIVNGIRYEGKGNRISGRYEIVDIDMTDGLKEIAVPEWGPSDDYATTFIRYISGKFIYMGKIPGSGKMMSVDGSGIIHTMVRGSFLHTWYFPATFVLDKKHTLHMVEQPIYPMRVPSADDFWNFTNGAQCTTKQRFPLLASQKDTTIVATMMPGEKFTIVASDNQRWCVVQTSVGTWGWFEVVRGIVFPAGVRAFDLMDGLCMAD